MNADIKKRKAGPDEIEWYIELPRGPSCEVCKKEIKKVGIYCSDRKLMVCSMKCERRIQSKCRPNKYGEHTHMRVKIVIA